MTDKPKTKPPSWEGLKCCEGGPFGVGCLHDHCTGPIKEKKPCKKNP